MSRSMRKGPFVEAKLLKKIKKINATKKRQKSKSSDQSDQRKKNQPNNKTNVIKTWSRSSTIIPIMIGNKIAIHNGREHREFFLTDQMVSHKLGEFAVTRTFKGHIKKDRRSKR